MSYDRGEYVEAQKKINVASDVDQMARLRHFRQAEVEASKLTGDPHWDVFLQIMQGEIERLREVYKALSEKALSPSTLMVDMDQIRTEGIRIGQTIETLELVIELPRMMRDDGEKAKVLLERLESVESAA